MATRPITAATPFWHALPRIAGYPRDVRTAQWALDAAIIRGERFGPIDEALH